MIIPNNATVYCDANFLVAYGARQIKQPNIQKQAQILFAQLLNNNCTITASPLTFDETWNGIRKEVGPKEIKNKWRFLISKFLNKYGLRLTNYGGIEFSYSEIINDLKNFTENLLSSSRFEILQFPISRTQNGVGQALDNLENFNLKPRDSFHLALMQTNNIQYMVTRDQKDFQRTGINVITF